MPSAVCIGSGGSLSFGCRWLIEDLRGFASWVVLSPETGYFVFGEVAVVVDVVELVELVVVDRGCLGMTNALVCLSSDRSLHRADISGKSRCLLFSRNVLISMDEGGITTTAGVDGADCCWLFDVWD